MEKRRAGSTCPSTPWWRPVADNSGRPRLLFERFTTRARRSIFFARYEASALGTTQITAEELMLGILREDKFVAARVGLDALLAIRKELEQLAAPKGERVPTSVDMAVSHETRRALE